MAAQAKPDSSYGTIRLTRRNAPRGHLLSNFNKPEPKDAIINTATIDKEAVQASVETKLEIGADTKPLSSDKRKQKAPKRTMRGITLREYWILIQMLNL